jgi:RNA methyltransferase, TrmH family
MNFLPIIQSVQNEWVKSLRKLHDRADRVERRCFLIEGTHAVEEAIATQWPLVSIVFDAKWAQSHSGILAQLASRANAPKTTLQPVSDDVLGKLSTTNSPCSVIAVASITDRSFQEANDHFRPEDSSFMLAAESLQDPGNLGNLIRVAAASGFGRIVLSSDSVDPTNPKVLRSTAGQWFRSPPIVTDTLRTWIRERKSKGFQVLAASAEGKSLWDSDLTGNTIVLLGNEGSGLSQDLRMEATSTIAIPMADGVESLNVAVSGALIAYEALRQRRGKVAAPS